jgi:hypothetical protein
MAIVMLNNSSLLSSNREVETIETKLRNNINYKSSLNVKYHTSLNSNGSGFIDNFACPISANVTMSGSALSTSLVYSGGLLYCSGTYSGSEVKMYVEPE